MASERQIQDRISETQADSLGIEQTQQSSINESNDKQIKSAKPTTESAKNSEVQDDLEHSQTLDLLTKNLRDRLNSVDTIASS